MEVVTGAMGSLLPKLDELLMGEYKLQKGVKEDVESLQREMKSMNAALVKVAEVPRDLLDNQVIIWADELRELSYDMEDVVDNFLVCVEGSESDVIADSNKLKWLVGRMANLFTKGKTRHQVGNAIRDIKNRAQEVAGRRDRYRVDDVANPAGKQNFDPRVLALYKHQKELVGIENARYELTKRLRDGPKQQQHKMKIVSIVGPGGLGKTTLAKAVYDRIRTQFEYTAFVPVGRNPEVKKVLRDILLEVDKKLERFGDVAILDEKQLIDKLRQLLENGRYLIVIDDIWDLKAWEIIKCALLDNNHGSRVITTTRILSVATETGDIYKLKPLSQHLSEELLYTRLFGGKDKRPFDQPSEVSNKILQKCGGLPLAIITIASLFAGKPMEDWSKVLNSIGFGSGDNNTDVENTRKILSFSYYDLPCRLRSCLLHMSIYPEDYLTLKDMLIWQWVAEGFVSEEPGASLFETGERYFNELLNRSMIQRVKHPGYCTIYACRMHDIVLDMICSLSKEQNFVTILDSNEEHTPSQCNARRLAVQKRVAPQSNMSMPKLRSCYATMCDPNAVSSLSNFQVLRVLAMEKCSFQEDHPYHLEHLGRLPQLRYLSLGRTRISKLPEEIGNLKFLQTLDLNGTNIEELPQSIGLLRKLKCLRADVEGVYINVSNWIGSLTSLKELHLSIVDKSYILVKELSKLTELRVLTFVCTYTGVDECWKKTFVDSVCNLRKLQILRPNFSFTEEHMMVFESVRCDYWEGYKPSRQLRDLVIIAGSFSRLPAWINSVCFFRTSPSFR
ncbi:disease resistance protein RGA5-like [Aegilops tauschii subsp. strangulata]|uniref:AAA+ ATPase domain-containing protein n=1 Tax=Aegilops tauschii subsp. strangulata TaxID=200361 RepID=A0A453MNP8_AEGTS